MRSHFVLPFVFQKRQNWSFVPTLPRIETFTILLILHTERLLWPHKVMGQEVAENRTRARAWLGRNVGALSWVTPTPISHLVAPCFKWILALLMINVLKSLLRRQRCPLLPLQQAPSVSAPPLTGIRSIVRLNCSTYRCVVYYLT